MSSSVVKNKILLLSDLPPCTNYSGGIHLAQLSKVLLKNDFEIFNFCIMDLSVEPIPDKELEGKIHYAMMPRPRELITRKLDNYYMESSIKAAIKSCIKYIQDNEIAQIWCPIQGEVVTRILDAVAQETKIPYTTQLWDPLEWWMHECKFNAKRSEKTLALYNKLIEESTSCVTASPAMSEFYSGKYGGDYYDVETMIFEDEYAFEKNAKPKKSLGKKIIIAMCGQTYAKDAIESLFAALESMDWEFEGKKVFVYHYGGPFSFTIGENKFRKDRVIKKGHFNQRELVKELRKADYLYCPYFFTKQYPYKQVSEMSFPSKLVTYFGVETVPIILHAPKYSSPYRYCNDKKCAILLESCIAKDLAKTMRVLFADYAKTTPKLLKKQSDAKAYFSEESVSGRFLSAIKCGLPDYDHKEYNEQTAAEEQADMFLSSSLEALKLDAEKQKKQIGTLMQLLKVVYYFNLIKIEGKNRLFRPAVLLRNSTEQKTAKWAKDRTRVLYLNNIDKYGKAFNGYDYQQHFNSNSAAFQAKLLVNDKLVRGDKNVLRIFSDPKIRYFADRLTMLEAEILDTKGQLSITDIALSQSKILAEADIVHINLWHNMHLSIPFLQEIRSKKVVLDIHDTFFLADDCDCKKCEKNQKSSIKMWGGIFDSKSNKHELCLQKKNVLDSISANLLTHSDYFKRFVAESVVTKDQPRVDVVRFGVDTNAYKNTHNQKELRAKYHIPEKNLVLFCRALSERKGIESIETALQNLELENVTVLTCSETGLLESVSDKYQVIERGEASQDELIQLFNVCDIFLCPSSEESFGFMAIEAMSCEKPTIIFDGTALPYTTFAPDCGYLVPQGDDVALMKAIVYLAKNPDERRRRGKLGRKLAKEHYDISKYYENLGTFYEKILNEAPRVVPEIVEKFEIDENAKNLISKLKEVYERLELKTKFTEVFPEFDVKLPVKKSQKPIEYSSDNTQALLRYFNKNLYKIIKKESKVLPSMVRKIKRIRRPRSALKT